MALPGVYTLKLTVDGKSYTQTVRVKSDPRSPATPMALRAQVALQMKIHAGITESWDGYQQVAALRGRVAEIQRQLARQRTSSRPPRRSTARWPRWEATPRAVDSDCSSDGTVLHPRPPSPASTGSW